MSYNIYDLILAIQFFKPETLDFLDSIRNRYTYSDTEFINHLKIDFQRLPIEVPGDKKLSFPSTEKFSIEKDWNKLKTIREKAKSLPEANTIDLSEFNKPVVKEYEERVVNTVEALNSSLSEIYDNTQLWDELTRLWLKLIIEYSSKTWKNGVNEFIKDFEIKDITFEKYLSIKRAGLGIRIEQSPKLYYNNLQQLMVDIVRQANAIENRTSFFKEWNLAKHNILNSQIIHPWLDKIDIEKYDLLEDNNSNLIIAEKDGVMIEIKMKSYGPSKIEVKLK